MTNKNNYPETVQQIHREFEFAAERLLDEAKQTIAEVSTKNLSKFFRLEKFGFKNTKEATEIKPLVQKAELSKEQVELVKYYQQHYPLNKFITEGQVKEICFKYGLVCGSVTSFKGFVPEKNLAEIERFKLNPKTKDYMFLSEETGELFCFGIEDFTERGKLYCTEREYDWYIVGENGRNVYGDWGLLTSSALARYSDRSYLRVQLTKSDNILQICAPVKDMDMAGMTIEDGYKLQKIHVPDPVVLHPVRGGYLILTAWGDEASDPIVTNPINN